MSTTIRDVAQRAGVGQGTVSRVLNGSSQVSPATRERVERAISELNYRPNLIAQSFASGRTDAVAVIAPFITRPSVVERLRGIERVVTLRDYQFIVYNVETAERRSACLRDVPRRDRIDGLVVISLIPTEAERAHIHDSGVPYVLIDGHEPSGTSVGIDDIAGGRTATDYLLSLGHRRIAFIGDFLDDPLSVNFTSSRLREQGYRTALEQAGIAVRRDYVRHGRHDREVARIIGRELLQLPERPQAIFAASDTQALGVVLAARDLQLTIPDDVSLIGFDDVEIAEFCGLTTIRQPLLHSGIRGAELLFGLIEQPTCSQPHQCLPVELIVRGSTRAAPA
jgi:DNA-binding LacI/PurR family transcriptional regulator